MLIKVFHFLSDITSYKPMNATCTHEKAFSALAERATESAEQTEEVHLIIIIHHHHSSSDHFLITLSHKIIVFKPTLQAPNFVINAGIGKVVVLNSIFHRHITEETITGKIIKKTPAFYKIDFTFSRPYHIW